jgi:ribosomal protein S21
MKEREFVCNGRFKGCARGASVHARAGESIDSLLGRFKKSVMDSNILEEYKDGLEFVKPSVKARQKKMMRKRRARLSNID